MVLTFATRAAGVLTSIAGCAPDLACRRYDDFETSREIPLQNLMQEQVYFFVNFEGSLGIERIKKCLKSCHLCLHAKSSM